MTTATATATEVRTRVDHLNRLDIASLIHPYTSVPVHESRGPMIIERAKGVWAYTHDGRDLLEGMAGLWSAALGFADEDLIDTATTQLRRLSSYHLAAHKSNEPAILLAAKLLSVSPFPASKVFLCNSGSEANDTQIKLLWHMSNARGETRRKKIISRWGVYHGATIGAGSLIGIPAVHRHFDLPLQPFLFTECPDARRFRAEGETDREYVARLAASLEQLIVDQDPDTVAGFIAEPIMGAGGVIIPPEGYFPAVQEVLRRYGIRLIDDEVITGIGRTGPLWAADVFGMKPTALTCGKSLSSGYLPIAAVLIDEEMYSVLREQGVANGPFAHGFTFGGHPVAAAVALRTLELIEERRVLDHVAKVAPLFKEHLLRFRSHPKIRDVRCLGLLGAIEFGSADGQAANGPSSSGTLGHQCVAAAERHGLILRALGNVVVFCPPLIITGEELDELFRRFTRALDDLS